MTEAGTTAVESDTRITATFVSGAQPFLKDDLPPKYNFSTRKKRQTKVIELPPLLREGPNDDSRNFSLC